MGAEHTEARPAPLRGYRKLNDEETDLLDQVKLMEQSVAELWGTIERRCESDPVLLKRAADLFRDAFMNLVRSVAKPRDPFKIALENNQQDEAEGVISARNPEAYRG